MTVFENVLTAARQGAALRGHASRRAAIDVLKRTNLAAMANRRAEGLRVLHRKRLELARALATAPRLLLLDEVADGHTDPEVDALTDIVRGVRSDGVAVVWIEHVVRALADSVDRLLWLAGGRFVADGDPHTVLADPAVREVHLGTATEAPWKRRCPAREHRSDVRVTVDAPLLEVEKLSADHG